MTTNDYQWLPMTTNDYQWLPMTTNYYQWPPITTNMTANDYQWLPKTTKDYHWLQSGYILAIFWLHFEYILTTFWPQWKVFWAKKSAQLVITVCSTLHSDSHPPYKKDLFLTLDSGTSSAQNENLRPLLNTNIPLISGKYGLRNYFWPLESRFLMRKSEKKSIFSKPPNFLILSSWILNLHIIMCQFQKRSTWYILKVSVHVPATSGVPTAN